ncbi:hypothetical protein FRC19_004906 [Serendipita sp. 401]|nr:hypothetical protein FRC19_004906 [Serendipita sp. 401]
MDQRTADSLFGTGDDNNVDFFAQSSATPSTQDAFTAEQVVEQPVEYTPDVTRHEYKTQEVVDDPYSQLRRTSTLRAQNTAPSTARADPYAATANAYQPRNYAPPITNSPPSTYGVPPSHASQPDPYASIGPRGKFVDLIVSCSVSSKHKYYSCCPKILHVYSGTKSTTAILLAKPALCTSCGKLFPAHYPRHTEAPYSHLV